MEIVSEYEEEEYGGTGYSSNYKQLTSPAYGTIYRVQTATDEERGPNTYSYVHGLHFKNFGTCNSLYLMEPAPAPCGDGFFLVDNVLLLSIRCTAQTNTGLEKCDKIVESMKKT